MSKRKLAIEENKEEIKLATSEEPKKFKPTNLFWTEKNEQEMNERGYTVVPNILTTAECDTKIGEMWDFLEACGSGIDRKDEKTWGNDKWPFHSRGIISYPHISHSKFVWDTRQHANVTQVFSEINKVPSSELLVGFCRASIIRPVTGRLKMIESWLHTDQSPHRKGRDSLQSVLNLADVGENDGGLVVMPKSHLLHQKFHQHFHLTHKKDWHQLNPEQVAWFNDQQITSLHVVAPKGSMIFWDSRTMHCSRSGTNTNFRYGIFVCMTPRSLATKDDLLAKQKNFLESVAGTSHTPHRVHPFGKKPHCWSKKDDDRVSAFKQPPRVFFQDLSEIGKRLAGF